MRRLVELSKRIHYPLLLALVLAVGVRVLPATYHFVIGTDEALYLTLGGHIAAGDGFTADGVHPHSEFDPGYPLVAALVYTLGNTTPFDPTLAADEVGRIELPARLNILLLGSLLCVPVYFLAREMVPGEKGFAARAALLTATVPALALGVPNFEAASEQLYTLALWMGWLCLWLGLNRRRWFWFVGSGLAFGVAHLTRYEGLVSAGMAVLVTLVWFWNDARTKTVMARVAVGNYAALTVLLLAGVLALAAPYALYQIARTGSVFSTKSIVHQLHGEALASADPYAWEKSYANYELVRDHPGLYPPLPVYLWQNREQTALNYVHNTVSQVRLIFTSPTFLFILWVPFAVLGAFKFKRKQNLFLAAALVPALLFPLSVVDARYLLPLVPAGMIWTARGLKTVDTWFALQLSLLIHRRPSEALQRWAPFLARLSPVSRYGVTLAIIALFLAVDLVALFFIPRPVEFRTAGLALRGTLVPQSPVLMRKRQFAFYANVSYESLPFSDLQGVRDYALTKNATYFELDARTTPGTRPQLVYLLEQPPPTTVEITFDNQENDRVVVFRIKQ